jgi:hypothetical protein
LTASTIRSFVMFSNGVTQGFEAFAARRRATNPDPTARDRTSESFPPLLAAAVDPSLRRDLHRLRQRLLPTGAG